MRLPFLLTADLHLTANPQDEYRWGIFPWLATECRRKKVRTLLILGDLTDEKDKHSADLVNRVADYLDRLSNEVDKIYIVMGNHDYRKEGKAFFSFLSYHPKIEFVTKPTVVKAASSKMDELDVLLLPHTKSPETEWYPEMFKKYDVYCMHQSVLGCTGDNGQVLSKGISPDFKLRAHQRLYSGDIHTPQVVGDVVYVGAPYPVHFGDSYQPRCILLEGDFHQQDLHHHTIQKLNITLHGDSLKDWPEYTYEGDQCKIKVMLTHEEKSLWPDIRNKVMGYAKKKKVVVVSLKMQVERVEIKRNRKSGSHDLTPSQMVEDYVMQNDLGGDHLEVGLSIVQGEITK